MNQEQANQEYITVERVQNSLGRMIHQPAVSKRNQESGFIKPIIRLQKEELDKLLEEHNGNYKNMVFSKEYIDTHPEVLMKIISYMHPTIFINGGKSIDYDESIAILMNADDKMIVVRNGDTLADNVIREAITKNGEARAFFHDFIKGLPFLKIKDTIAYMKDGKRILEIAKQKDGTHTFFIDPDDTTGKMRFEGSSLDDIYYTVFVHFWLRKQVAYWDI